ncbi:MAG: hypoxanthine-guanine phosphoribosyltransferase [Pseudomonadota bacterium]
MNNEKYDGILQRAELLYSKEDINNALDKIAEQITAKVKGKNPIFLCVMNGGLVVGGQLMPRLNFPLRIDCIQTSRYGIATEGGDFQWLNKPCFDLKRQCVVIIEDIIDTGITLTLIKDYCFKVGASEVYVTALVDKHERRAPNGLAQLDFYTLPVPDKYVIGCGLDYQHYFRNLPAIYAMAASDTV